MKESEKEKILNKLKKDKEIIQKYLESVGKKYNTTNSDKTSKTKK